MKNILVPTDFSDCAKAAEDAAMEIAKKADGEVHFLHSIHTPVDWVRVSLNRESLFPEIRAQIGLARHELKKIIARCNKAGVRGKEFLVFDKGLDEIYKHVADYDLDIIVMGTKGEGGVRKFVGSNTEQVVRYSKVPVLSLKKKLDKTQINDIVFASHFTEEGMKAFCKIAEFADLMNAKIHFLSVNTPSEFMETEKTEKQIREFISKNCKAKSTVNIINALDVESGIKSFVKIAKADLISIATHGRKGFAKMKASGITEGLVNNADVPVLSVNISVK